MSEKWKGKSEFLDPVSVEAGFFIKLYSVDVHLLGIRWRFYDIQAITEADKIIDDENKN